MIISRSTNGGISFSSPRIVTNHTQTYRQLGKIISTSMPSIAADPINGYLYMVYMEKRSEMNNNQCIKFTRSTSDYKVWETPQIIADIGTGWQFFPVIAVDSNGRIAVNFLHCEDPLGQQLVDVYIVESYNHGEMFRSPFKVSDVSFDPAQSNHGYWYQDLAVTSNGDNFPSWTDHRNGNADPYTFIINAPPAAPQNLEVSAPTLNHPYIEWDANVEPDIKEYKVYRKIDSGNWDPLETTSNNYYWDEDATIQACANSIPATAYYKATAIDYSDQESLYSNEDDIRIEVRGGTPDLKMSEIIPNEFSISQNFPNPFNPETNITFGIPEDNFVSLVVYNIQGEKIATLVNEELSAGSYTAKFYGSLLPSGVYIYKIQTGSYSQFKRMLLIK